MIVIPKGTPLDEMTRALDCLSDPEKARAKFERDKQLLKSDLPILFGDQLFTWTDPEDDQLYHFNGTALYRYWRHNQKSGEKILIMITEDTYKFTLENRGIERYRVDRLTPASLRTPVIVIQQHTLGKDWDVIIDGSHRVVYAYEQNHNPIIGVRFLEQEWKKCLIHTPNAQIPASKWSGIL